MPDAAYTVRADGARVRTLVKPIMAHGGTRMTEIVLSQPTYRNIMDFGDPSMLIVVENGAMPDVNMGTVEKYVQALSGIDIGLLDQMDYRDAIALKDAVLDFFKTASATPSSAAPTP